MAVHDYSKLQIKHCSNNAEERTEEVQNVANITTFTAQSADDAAQVEEVEYISPQLSDEITEIESHHHGKKPTDSSSA